MDIIVLFDLVVMIFFAIVICTGNDVGKFGVIGACIGFEILTFWYVVFVDMIVFFDVVVMKLLLLL